MTGVRSNVPRWNRRSTLVLAMAGSAAGLGGLALLPVQAARHGGAAFMTAYFALLLLLGLPLLWAEWTIGRRGGTLGYTTLPGMLQALTRARAARYAGALGVALPLVLAVVLVNVQSWALGHAFDAFTGALPAGEAGRHLDAFLGNEGGFLGQPGWRGSPALYAFFALTLAADVWLLLRGPLDGLAAAARVGLPVLLLAALLLAACVVGLPEPAGRSPADGLLLGWTPGWQPLVSAGADAHWAAAAGAVVLTLGVGSGVVATLAAPLREGDDLPLSSLAAASIGQLVAVVFGSLLLLPAAYVVLGADGLQRSASDLTTLSFVAVPEAFASTTLPGIGSGAAIAVVLGGLWFTLLFVATLLSTLALCLPAVSFLRDAMGLSHRQAVLVTGLLVALASQPVLLLPGVLGELSYWVRFPGLLVLALIEVLLLVAAFGSRRAWDHLHRGAAIRIPRPFRFALAVLVPLLLLARLGLWAWREAGPVLWQQVGPDGAPYSGTERNALLARGLILGLIALFTVFVAVASRRGYFRPLDTPEA
jgi:SNF family Na+-dependent transporter